MGLRDVVEADLEFILEDGVLGFGRPIVLTDPDGTSANFTGYSNDIAQLIDPETGQAVSGRLASVAIRMSSIFAAGMALPQGIADASKKPWIVDFNDINGNAHKFKVQQSNPDRGLGVVTCLLESFE